jgi:hypothetical protein
MDLSEVPSNNSSERPAFFALSSGEEVCDEEYALSVLLKDDVLFCNERETFFEGKGEGSTVVLYVNCNDIFAWGCADSETLHLAEIGDLYKRYKADPVWGVAKWCCIRRKQQPQPPVKESMKKDGVWDDVMEALPKNTFDREVHEAMGIKYDFYKET